MFSRKMTGNLYEDVLIVDDAITSLYSMVNVLEKECIARDKDKPATELFIRINGLKEELKKMASESEMIVRRADIDHFGPLSRFVRPYLTCIK